MEEKERKLRYLIQTEEESAFFMQQFALCILSRVKRCTVGERDARADQQEGSAGSAPAAMWLDPPPHALH